MKDYLRDRIAGALYGVAVGDALGAPLEFMSAEEIRRMHGFVTEMIGGGWLNVQPGEITDDTQMTLAVAEGIVEAPDAPCAAIGKRFIEWLASGPKDVGGTCSAAIRGAMAFIPADGYGTEEDWFRASELVSRRNGGRSGGNGALMRTVYPGLYYTTETMAGLIAEDIARMTHWDDLSAEACTLYTRIVYLITTFGKFPSLLDVEKRTEGTPYSGEAMYGQTLNPTGFVVDSLKCALHSFRTTCSFEDAVARAANLGGDADTIAAITGGLAGAFYGFDAIPDRWISSLSSADRWRIDALVEAAIENRKAGASCPTGDR